MTTPAPSPEEARKAGKQFLLAILIAFLLYVTVYFVAVRVFLPLAEFRGFAGLLGFFTALLWFNRAPRQAVASTAPGGEAAQTTQPLADGQSQDVSNATPPVFAVPASRAVPLLILLSIAVGCHVVILENSEELGFLYLIGFGFVALRIQELWNSRSISQDNYHHGQAQIQSVQSILQTVWKAESTCSGPVVIGIAGVSILIWSIFGALGGVLGLDVLIDQMIYGERSLQLVSHFLLAGSVYTVIYALIAISAFMVGRFMAYQILLRTLAVLAWHQHRTTAA